MNVVHGNFEYEPSSESKFKALMEEIELILLFKIYN